MAPRVKPADGLDPQAIIDGWRPEPYTEDGQPTYVRVPQYKKGHRIGVAGHTARCGVLLIPDLDWWKGFRRNMHMGFNRDPGEFYIAIDRRKGDKCGDCKKDRDWSEYELEGSDTPIPPPPEETPPKRDPRTLTVAEKMVRQRLQAAAARVARDLGAEILP